MSSKTAEKWQSLPNGWTQESVDKFWESLTGAAKHKVTKCIEKMGPHMDDPGAFCASLADKVDPGWRSRQASVTSDALDAIIPSSIYPFVDDAEWGKFLKGMAEIVDDLGSFLYREGWGKFEWDYSGLKEYDAEDGEPASIHAIIQVSYQMETSDFVERIVKDPDIARTINDKMGFTKAFMAALKHDTKFKQYLYKIVNKNLMEYAGEFDAYEVLDAPAKNLLGQEPEKIEQKAVGHDVHDPSSDLFGFWVDFDVDASGPKPKAYESYDEPGPDPDDIRDWQRDMADYRTIAAAAPSKIKMWDGKEHPVDRKAWAYKLNEAKKNKKWAEAHEYASNPDAWPASDMSKKMLKDYLTQTVEQMTLDSYMYFWWRAHLNQGFHTVDPAARRDWEKITGKPIPPEEIIGTKTASSEEIFPKTIASFIKQYFTKQFADSGYEHSGISVDYKPSSLRYNNGVPWTFYVTIKGISSGSQFISGASLGSVLSAITGKDRPADAKYAAILAITNMAEKAGFKVGYPARSPNPGLVHGRDLGFVFHMAEYMESPAGRLAKQWILKQAQEPSTIQNYLGGLDKLPPIIINKLKAIAKSEPLLNPSRLNHSIQAHICGFIYVMFTNLLQRDAGRDQKIWNLFEHGGPSMAYGTEVHQLADQYRRYFAGSGPEAALKAAAVALDMLRRGRMPQLQVKLETVLNKELAPNLANAGPAQGASTETEAQTLKRLVEAELPAARGLLFQVGTNPLVVRAYVSDILEDANWHRLSGELAVDSPVELDSDIISSIAADKQWDVVGLGIFGMAALSLVKDKAGISLIKSSIKSQFPDYLAEQAM